MNTLKTYSLVLLSTFLFIEVQAKTIERVEPLNWWIGMKDPNLQVMVYGTNISSYDVAIDYQGVTINAITKTSNPNYLFIDLTIDNTTPSGKVPIVFSKNKNKLVYEYELFERQENANHKPKISGNDNMYLITPDRFANGDVSNDNISDLIEQSDRSKPSGRHGGDIQGIINHLDYIKNLGMTALWINPLTENNQEMYTYHGYAISDFYKIDKRFGTNKLYKQLASELHRHDMKLIVDLVFNHCGSGHWWMKDLPTDDWINSKDYGRSVFQNSLLSDPHASQFDYNKQTKGYFDTNMPDLNCENTFLATYLIQNSIWWIEYANIDGLRIDTYPYPDKDFMAKWRHVIEQEYPGIYVVAEIWVNDVAYAAYWDNAITYNDGYVSGITSITDFPVCYGMIDGFKEGGDVWKTYHMIAKDFLYGNAYNNLVFFDNHDIARSYASLGHNMNQFKLGIAFTLTTRGILQWYYGTEIAMNESENHGVIREDMPGGWKNDSINVFAKNNLNTTQLEALNYTTRLLNWRKQSKAIENGKLIHFLPENNCYVYFRVSNEETVMVILNNGETQNNFDLSRYNEILQNYTKAQNVIDGNEFDLSKSISIDAITPYVLILK